MNPLGNVFCSRCNTRLLSTEMQLPEKPKPVEEAPVGVKGISLPTLPTAKEGTLDPDKLPDWLLELTEQPLSKPAESPGMEEPAPAEEFPDWLSSLMDDAVDNAVDETADARIAGEPAPEDVLALTEFPDWLSDLTDETVAPEDGAPEAPAESATADWFADLLEDETAQPIEAGIEAEAKEELILEELPDHSLPDFAAEPRAELPDWLLATASPEPSGKTPTAQPLPDWLLQNAVEPTPGQEAGAPSELPAWLLKDAESGAAPRTPASPRLKPIEVQERTRPATELTPSPLPVIEPEEELEGKPEPDWLADLYPEEEPELQTPPSVQEPAAEVAPEGEEPASSLPDWLMGMYEEESEPQAPVLATESEADAPKTDTPDWLTSIYGEEEAEPQAAAFSTEFEEAAPEAIAPEASTPDWLASIYGEEEAEPQTAAFTTEFEEAASEATAPEAGVPDWLASIHSTEEAAPSATTFTAEPGEEIVPETGTPDWLAGIMAGEPVPEQSQASSEQEPTTGMDVPDWLAGLATEAPSTEGEEQSAPFAADSALFTEVAPEEPGTGPSAMPDWLKSVKAPDEETGLKPAQPAFVPGEAAFDVQEDEAPGLEEGEVPDWLKGLASTTPSPVEEEAAFYERVSEDESLVRAEVPSWLQGLRPPGTGPLPPLPEMMMPGAEVPLPQEGGLVRAEIPDWVQQLRPAPSAEGEAGEKHLLEPTETEGPLAGLRGMLPLGPAIDMPADFQAASSAPIPESIVAQAQLWQKLLEQPRSVQRPVAQHHTRSGSGQLATRWIVVVVLLAVTAIGLLWSDARLSQALSNPHIENFSKAIETLGAGDTVIVAVEYGPAEAGEMALLAQAVVQHLADRNVRVTMVSTLPEGGGLIHSLLEPLALANRLPAGQAAYLPGSSTGVAQFLSGPTEAKLIIVLAGRAERLRWWVEQNNATQATTQTQPLPMAIAVNAATAPLAMPYLETSPVTGWMAGLPDAAAYQEFRGLSSSVLNSQLDALMLAHWAALALLLFGLFYYLALGKKGAS